MSLWIMQVNNLPLLWIIYPLELESKKRHLKRPLIVTGNLVLAFSPYLSEQILHVLAILVYKLMSLLESNTFDAFQVITARKNTSHKKHVHSESTEVELLDDVEVLHINFESNSISVHLEEALGHSKREKIRVLSDHKLYSIGLEHVSKLRVSFIRRYNVIDP